mmetsp:Transcript_8096/g.14473  ORF Transcript_8096/g.14473 Transcript_8096/m.14473 type:complete len:254 (+) Transcript_8096:1421-2182(+)
MGNLRDNGLADGGKVLEDATLDDDLCLEVFSGSLESVTEASVLVDFTRRTECLRSGMSSTHTVFGVLVEIEPRRAHEAKSAVKSVDTLHLRVRKTPVEYIAVGVNSLWVKALGDYSGATLDTPPEEYLARRLANLFGDLKNGFVLEKRRVTLVAVTDLAKRRIGDDVHTLGLAKLKEAGLLEVGMHFNLESERTDVALLEKKLQGASTHVGDTKVAHESETDEAFHGLISLHDLVDVSSVMNNVVLKLASEIW